MTEKTYTETEVKALVAAALQPLLKAADMLSACAQTTGGTAGRDDGLVSAIEAYSEARLLIPADHAAALDAVKAQAWEEAWKELQRGRPFILGANHGWDEALEWAADQVSALGKARVDENVRAWAKDRAAAIRAGKGQP